MARIDRNSNPSWSYLEQVHHDLDIAPDGRIYTLTHELSSDVPEAAPQLDAPYLKDFLVVLSEDGRELEKISLTEPFLRSRYKFLFTTLPYYALADPLHTNSVEYISDEKKPGTFPSPMKATCFSRFGISRSSPSFSMKTREITWAARGAWLQQHGPTLLPDGDILLFDNFGDLRDENSSRVVQFDPRTANVTWEYGGAKPGARCTARSVPWSSAFPTAIRSSLRRMAGASSRSRPPVTSSGNM
ncbi:hypothetical protein QW131_09515 [Roseibium salinum]|nr:hypothetical protein [Roseibium salinum]